MTIHTAIYKEKFPTFQFLNCDIGFEGSLGENENPLTALKQLRELAIAFHKQEFPHLYVSPEPVSENQGRIMFSPHEPKEQISQKDLEQKLILMLELQAAKTSQEVTTIYNESPLSIRTDQEFFSAVLAAKERVKTINPSSNF